MKLKIHPSVQRIIDQQALPPEQRDTKSVLRGQFETTDAVGHEALAASVEEATKHADDASARAADANERAEAARAALEALAAPKSVQRAIAIIQAVANERRADPRPYNAAPSLGIAWAQRETFRQERQARAEATLEAVPQR